MKVAQTKSHKIKQVFSRLAMGVTGLALVAGAMFAFRSAPMVDASTNPGLDSGNATVTTVGGDTILTYKTVGNSTFKAPAGATNVRVLAVGGAGGGGAGESLSGGDGGGGGGGGEYLHQTSVAVTPGAAVTVTVGGGGTGSTTKQPDGGNTQQNGTNGGNSVFGSLTARGGGGGGGNDQSGLAGGSGGGAGGRCSNNPVGGAKTAVAPGLGNAGGVSAGTGCSNRAGSGGGGAGAVGVNSTGSAGAAGGVGVQNDITGTNVFYSAGASGGSVGSNATGATGAANSGSGGGGGGSGTSTTAGFGGNGGTGVVIVRFATKTSVDVAGVTGLVGWYKADGAGNTNSQWNDVSGLGFTMTQATGAKQPALTTNQLNYNPAYVFDGTDDAFTMPAQGVGASDTMAAFYSASLTDPSGGYHYLTEFGDDTPSISVNNGKPNLYARGTSPVSTEYSTIEALSPRIYSFVSPTIAGTRIVGVNNKEETGTYTGGYTTSTGGTGNMFGAPNVSSGKSFKGPIGEAMYFNRQLTQPERQRINSYLAIKYGVTLYQGVSGTAYLASNNATIWPADATYKNAVTGIGRDDASTLNQKQSKNVDDIVAVGRGDIAASNQANANTFTADRTFLTWAHNGGVTDQATTVTGTDYVRMGRIWKTVSTGTVGTVKLQIPKSEITRSTASVFISNSATFSNTSTRVDMTSNGSNYEAVVTLPAGAYFTFGSLAGSDIEFISKTATNSANGAITSYTPGESIKYILKVKNNGPDAAGIVTVSDTLPASVLPVSATGSGWNCGTPAGQIVTCTLNSLASGVTASDIVIEANIASSTTGTKANTATATTANDPNSANNSASVSLTAAPKADLSISKGHTGTPVAGNPHTYKFTVTNNGPADVASFTVTDTLNSNLTLASSTNNMCSPVGGTTITCTGGALTANGAGSTVSFDMVVNVDPLYGGGTITNTGTVVVPAGTTDPNAGNNSSTDSSNVTVDTDLGITKSHTGDFTAGVNNDFTLAVENQGPSNAPTGSVTITDTLDDDFAFVSASGTGWNCTETSGTVSCTNTADINAGNTAPDITLTVLVDSVAKGSVDNTAEVSSTTPDSDLTDNTSTNTVTVVSDADLGIVKARVNSTFVAGAKEQYTFTVTNDGPSADAPSYSITDVLPAGVTFDSSTGAASCTGTTTITCIGGGITAGGSAQVTTVTVNIPSNATGTLANTATIAAAPGTTDPNMVNNTSTDNAPVEPNADLSMVKTHTGNLTAGADETYTFTVTNDGPSDVSSFTITDTLDFNLTYQSATGATCGAVGQAVTCTGGGITSGNQAVVDVVVTVNASATTGATIANTAEVTPPAAVNDPDMSNNDSTVSNTVDASADLSITKAHTGNFTAGSNTNDFTIEVTNNGPSDATVFTMTDVLPAGMTYVNGTGAGVTCNNAGQTVTCTYGPTVPAGQTVTITLTVAVDADIVGGTTLDNSASVASATPDPNMANNTDGPDTVDIDSSADLAIVKTHSTPDFTAGNNESYSLAITNNGPSDVSSYTIADTLDPDLTYVSANPSICGGSSGQTVACTGGAIASGDTVTVVVTVSVDPGVASGTDISNTASVATVAPTTDPTPGNNSSTIVTTVVDSTDLALTKAHVGTFTAGANGDYTISVSNNGPSNTPTNDVTVTDTLPANLTLDSYAGAGWTCTGTTDVSCNYAPALTSGATAALLTLTVAIPADQQGDVTNDATVSSTTDDPNPGNDTDTDTTTIDTEADLTATKQAQGPLTAGEPVTYRFEVTNNGGPSDANNVTITDDLQGHFTYQSFAGTGWNCSETGGTVTCTLGSNLTVGSSSIVDVTLLVAQDAPNPTDNTAAVTFNGTDPTPANPSDSEPVSYEADLEVKLSHESKTYRSGDTVKFTYTVINHGPSTATDVVLTDTLPSGLSFESIVAAQSEAEDSSVLAKVVDTILGSTSVSAAPNTPFSCSNSGQSITCNASSLAVGTYTLQMTAQIADTFTGDLTSMLAISSATPDPNSANNSASDTIQGILAALGGLAGTGQNIFIWLLLAGVMIGTPAVLAIRRHKTRIP